MIRRAAAFRRPLSSGTSAPDELFAAAWRRVVPNVDPPKIPATFFTQPRPPSSSTSIPTRLTVNLISKHHVQLCDKQVDTVEIPETTGQLCIIPGQTSSASELKPGLISIHEENKISKYFLSSGFAFAHSCSFVEIIAVSIVPVEQVDSTYVKKGLVEWARKLSIALNDAEKVEAQIGIDVLSALNSSLNVQSM